MPGILNGGYCHLAGGRAGLRISAGVFMHFTFFFYNESLYTGIY